MADPSEPSQTPPPAGDPAAESPSVSAAPAAASTDAPDKDARTWGMIAHLASLAGFTGIPFANIIGPLIVWMVKKEEMPFVDDQGKEALNFQITMTIALVVSAGLMCLFIGFILFPIVAILDLVFTIIAALKANEGVRYRYPWTLRLVK